MIRGRYAHRNDPKPTIYLPVEIKARELKAKVLLAMIASRNGFRVYLGTKHAVDRLVKRKMQKGGIYFYKGGKPASTLEKLRYRVDHFVVLDEEMGPAVQELDRYYQGRIYPGTEGMVDQIFLIGQTHLDALRRVRPKLASRAHVTGWPRVDLWRPEFKRQFESEVEALRRRFGDYLLFSSDFGIVSEDTLEAERERLRASNFTEETRNHFLQQLELAFRDFLDFIELVRTIDSDPTFPPLVIRPHPSEDIGTWHRHLPLLRKTYIAFDGEISPWLYASRGLIHRGCTTAVQAYFSQIPAIYIGSANTEPKKDTLSYLTSHFAPSFQILSELAIKVWNGELSIHETQEVKNHIRCDATLASENIVSRLMEMETTPELRYRDTLTGRVIETMRGSVSAFRMRHGLGLNAALLARSRRKTGGGIHAGEINEILKKIAFKGENLNAFEESYNLIQLEKM